MQALCYDETFEPPLHPIGLPNRWKVSEPPGMNHWSGVRAHKSSILVVEARGLCGGVLITQTMLFPATLYTHYAAATSAGFNTCFSS